MKKQCALFVLMLVAGCDDDPTREGRQVTCPTPSPQLAGTWVGTMQNQQLAVTLADECFGDLFGNRFWMSQGGWTWSGRSGLATAFTGTLGVDLHLRMGTPPQPISFVSLFFQTPIPVPATTTLTGYADGSWRVPTDTMTVVAAFDSVALTLVRQ